MSEPGKQGAARGAGAPLISVEQAQARILRHCARMEPEPVPLSEAHRRVLAVPVVAPHDVPPFRNSAMDGYALRAADIATVTGGHPALLPVVGLSAAGGAPPRPLPPGKAMRIMTGAPLPEGADTVVRFEETSDAEPEGDRPPAGTVAIRRAVAAGANVRHAGEDMRAGHTVLVAGTRLLPPQIGLLAALGQQQVRVVRRPRVAILSTGDELLEPGEPLAPGRIRNSNEPMLSAWVAQAGGEPLPLGIARDDPASLRAKLQEAQAARADLILTSAGVSVGDYDVVKEVLATVGEMEFWQVAIKPGKPLAFGQVHGPSGPVPLIGLPGNPVAAAVAFHVFAQPAIRTLAGRSPIRPPRWPARLEEAVENSGRQHYLRARVWHDEAGTRRVTTRESGVRVQGSGILSALAWANCFAIVPASVYHLAAGTEIMIEPIDWSEEEI